MKRFLLIGAILLAGYAVSHREPGSALGSPQSTLPATAIGGSDAILANAYSSHAHSLQVSGEGTVYRLLPDDNNGTRHQRFLIRLASGQTLLVAHNINIAPRVDSLREGDSVQFNGEYAWNDKGGVIHWTHRDRSGRHLAGWLLHKGRKYQ